MRLANSFTIRRCVAAMMIVVAAALPVLLTGCAKLRHELQPHRLRKINSGPPPSWDPEFSSLSVPGKLNSPDDSCQAPSIGLSANSAEIALVRSQNED